MPHNKPINILFTYLHTPNINGIRSLVEQAISEINSSFFEMKLAAFFMYFYRLIIYIDLLTD